MHDKGSDQSAAGLPVALTGKTKLGGTVADPVDHLRAPESMTAYFAEHGIDAIWLPFQVAPAELARFVDGTRAFANMPGYTVTIPHKKTIVPLLDEVSEVVRASGVCNMVRREPDGRLVGDIADGIGFVAGLDVSGVAIEGRSIGIVGAGGAGTAIAWALAPRKPGKIIIVNRTRATAERMASDLKSAFPDLACAVATTLPADADIAVNSTSLGLHADDPLPFDPAALRAGATVVEIILKPPVTALLAKAAARGLATVPGQRMLDGQLQIYAEWLGFVPRGA